MSIQAIILIGAALVFVWLMIVIVAVVWIFRVLCRNACRAAERRKAIEASALKGARLTDYRYDPKQFRRGR